jgi:hypothetical protein
MADLRGGSLHLRSEFFGMIREVNKRLWLIIVLVVLILVVVFFVIRAGRERGVESVTPDGTPVFQPPLAEVIDDTWNKITFPMDGVSVQIPQGWDTDMYNTLARGVISKYENSRVTLDFHLNYDERTHASNIERYAKNLGYSITYEGEGANQIARYVGLVPMEMTYQTGDGEISASELAELKALSKNSYAVGQIVPFHNGSLIIHCQVSGPNYASLIKDCNTVVESLTIE